MPRALWDAAIAGGPIDILINNAGFGYFRRFDEVDWARDAELVQLNMTSLVALARCFVDAHKASTGPAHMLNISSTGACQSLSNMALYAASKTFVRNFSEGLHDEHRGTPLSVTCIWPGGTETAFHAASGGGDYSWIANASTNSSPARNRIDASHRCRIASVLPSLSEKLTSPKRPFATDRNGSIAVILGEELGRDVSSHEICFAALCFAQGRVPGHSAD
ncbi:MAG TPA: SDR family NAD(P)-dependent oxidoreductase [Rhodanobacter sp.]|nr:SDR family NAD(P)-dependent oxidoreductase [Rhodanobacter sp.]